MPVSTIDILVIAGFMLVVIVIGLVYSRPKKGQIMGLQAYFLADKTLSAKSVGGYLTATYISAATIIGLTGSAGKIGIAIAGYNLIGALVLILVAKYLLPVFFSKGIYTLPQFMEHRFDRKVRSIFAVFLVLIYVFGVLIFAFHMGAVALSRAMGISMGAGMIILILYTSTFSFLGGLKAVVKTSNAQLLLILLAGFLVLFFALSEVGLGILFENLPEKFDLVLGSTHPNYGDMPGISALIGGIWILSLYYFGGNQYMLQGALASKSLKDAQKGTLFAAFLQLLIPVLFIIPGIALYLLAKDQGFLDEGDFDSLYFFGINYLLPSGIRGLVIIGIIGAIGSTLSALVHSTATILTLDIYRPYFMKGALFKNSLLDSRQTHSKLLDDQQESHLVYIGKLSTGLVLLIGGLFAFGLLNTDSVLFYQFQQIVGHLSPGIVCILLFGLFWKRATAKAAYWVLILTIPCTFLINYIFAEASFLNRIGVSFLILSGIMIAMSLAKKQTEDSQAIHFENKMFKTDKVFNISAIAIVVIVAMVYLIFW